jgi:methionyl-tRNA formyltransferase
MVRDILKARNDQILEVVVVPPHVKAKGMSGSIKQRFSVFGFGYVFKVGYLVVTMKLKKKLGMLNRPSSVEEVCRQFSVKYSKTESVNSETFLRHLKTLNLDLIISLSPPQIFKKGILDIPKLGVINLHGALLPDYKGLQPSFWALAKGESKTGCTVHTMDEKIDEGNIIIQKTNDINGDDTQFSIIFKNKMVGAQAVVEAIDLFNSGEYETVQRPMPKGGSYYSFPTKNDVNELKRNGKELITFKDVKMIMNGW